MKKLIDLIVSEFNKGACSLFGHKYRLRRRINSYVREVECVRCKKQFSMHDEYRTLIEMDDEFRAIHEQMFAINQEIQSLKSKQK